MDVSLLNWNPRGLNNSTKRKSIHCFVSNHSCNMVVFQETKMAEITAAVVSEAVGPQFASNFIYKPVDGTRGGILIACSDDFAVVLDPLASSAHFIMGTTNGSSWTMTAVYGPQEDDAWLMTSPLGTPRGRCDEYSSKIFLQLRNQGFIDQEKSGQYD
jgi:hypothetical protein